MEHRTRSHTAGRTIAGLLAILVFSAPAAALAVGAGPTVAGAPTFDELAQVEGSWNLVGVAAVDGDPGLTVTGEPTEEEFAEITAQWARFLDAFGGMAGCMGPIEVRVVARAEDWYHSRDVGPIASFYTFPPDPVIFIEHRKVLPPQLLHEFAHHLDVSCDAGDGPMGAAFRDAQGIPADRGWFRGDSWGAVPAEAFAEAVVEFFGETTRIDVDEEAVAVIRAFSRGRESRVTALPEQQLRAAVPVLLLSDEGETALLSRGRQIYAI